jgi:hypothetical protein
MQKCRLRQQSGVKGHRPHEPTNLKAIPILQHGRPETLDEMTLSIVHPNQRLDNGRCDNLGRSSVAVIDLNRNAQPEFGQSGAVGTVKLSEKDTWTLV